MFAITVGWDEETGKQKRKPISYHATRAEAVRAREEYTKRRGGNGMPSLANPNTTLGQLYEKWAPKYYSMIGPDTAKDYENAWKKWLSRLADRVMWNIVKDDLQDIVTEMEQLGKSRSLMEKYKTLCGLLWDEALSNRLTDHNYGKMIKLPRSRKAKKPTFNDMQLLELRKAADAGDKWAGTIMILNYTGMRPQEMLILTRFNVDAKTWVITGGIKTDAGRDRVMPVNPKIQPYINYWLENPGPTLIHRDGKPMSVDYYRKHIFYPTLERLGIDYKTHGLTPYSCRHTFATLLNRAGANKKSIQELMGHEDYSTTAGYTHPDLSELREAVNLL